MWILKERVILNIKEYRGEVTKPVKCMQDRISGKGFLFLSLWDLDTSPGWNIAFCTADVSQSLLQVALLPQVLNSLPIQLQ